jgi:hypothetical protein
VSPSYKSFTLEVDDRAIDIITSAVYGEDLRVLRGYDDTQRVRSERVLKDKVHEALNRAATLQRVQR